MALIELDDLVNKVRMCLHHKVCGAKVGFSRVIGWEGNKSTGEL